MISIRDADKEGLEFAVWLLSRGQKDDASLAKYDINKVIKHIEELSQQAPVIEPKIAPMSEADKRICYPERYA